MRKYTLLFLIFLSTALLSINADAQTWYWTSQADSSTSQFASQVAVDRKNNPVYTGYCSGTRMSFGHNIGIDISGVQGDFLAKYNTNGVPLWAKNAKALNLSAEIYGMTVATDRNNAVIEAGYFDDSIGFGSYHLHSVGSNENSYIVKYDANGTLLWAASPKASVTTNCENYAYTISTDKMNNVLVTGYFQDTAYFGGTTLAAAGTDLFLVKYSSAGAVLWAKTAVLAGGASVYGLSVATDDSDNVYVSGNFTGTVTFGLTPSLTTGAESIFLTKYDSTGKAKWALNTTANPGQMLPTPVVVDRSNNVYLGAQFTNASITFNHSTVTNTARDGASNAMLIKYTRNGVPIWATCADCISANELDVIVESSVATDRCKNVYWSGLCSDTFGVGPVKVTVPGGSINQSTPFAYVIQMDSNGTAVAGAALANQNLNSFSNYLAVDSLSKALFVTELDDPATLVIGNDTVNRYLSNATSFLSKFAVIPAIISNSNNNNDSICLGDSIRLRVISIVGTTYTWSNGKTTDSITVKPSVTTNYYVIINNGCIIDTSYVKVTVLPAFAGIHGTDSICRGDTALLIGSGGGTYLWSNSQTTSSIKVTPTITTTYTLAVSNGRCSKDTTFTVHVSALPVASITSVPANDSICKGDSVLLSGSGGTTYKWSTGKTTSSIWVSPIINTTYTLYAHGSITCSDSAEVTVKLTPLITASASASKDTICPTTTTTLTVTGAGGQVTYHWSTGATTSTINVSPTVTTKYIATVTGACNTVKDTVTITVVPLANPVISGTLLKCKGLKDTLTVTSSINPTTYVWSNGSTSTSIITGDINADSTIFVTAENSLGCPVTDTFHITEKAYPTATVKYNPECGSNPDTITANALGTPPFTYQWSTGGTYDTVIVTVPDTTTLTVIISNGCPITKKVTIIPYFPALSACCNTTINIGNDTTISAVGTGITTYQWSPNSDLNCDTCATVIATPTITTTYTVTGRDKQGCETSRTVTIVVETPCFNFTVPNVFTPTNPGVLGLDNLFYIKTSDISSWSILIYDRWGKEMFKSTNPDISWNGNTESGGQAPAGVYYYIIDGTCQNNTYKKQGFVQLIR